MFVNIMSRLPYLSLVMALLITAGCQSSKNLATDHPTTSATLWMQNAAEYNALTTMVYRSALQSLSLAKEDSYWSASLQQKGDELFDLPPAVILDVDETVLDNSAFQARMIRQNTSFSPEAWNRWVREAQADPIPGALDFTRQAKAMGFTVIYLTNREHEVETATRENLKELGFPLSEDKDLLFTKNEQENWTSDKVNRRAYIAKHYRIAMLVGDNLNDFLPAKDITEKQRALLVIQHREKWGRKWFILPNPVYGSWEQSLYNFDSTLTRQQIEEIRRNKLNTKQQAPDPGI